VKALRSIVPCLVLPLLVLPLVACSHRPVSSPRSSIWAPRPAFDATGELPLGPATAVITLELQVPTAVLHGPFLVTTINPGRDLVLAVASRACDEPGLVWFDYSGGGVAAGAGQILCARSLRGDPQAQAFSGRHEAVTGAADGP
jgi:hypothetical protein